MDSVSDKILRYISDSAKEQALLLSGAWGSGKTYYIKKVLQKELERREEYKKYKILYISLYGVNSLIELRKVLGSRVLEEGFVKKDFLSQGKHKVAFINNIFKNINLNAFGMIDIGIGISDIINLEKIIDYSNMILVFDDLERCTSIDLQDLFGFINSFTEHKKVPVIVVAYEEQLKRKEEYNNIKEKSVYRDVVFTDNLLSVYSNLVETLNVEKRIRTFLVEQFKMCMNQFERLNLRDIKFFLNNWVSLFNEVKEQLDPCRDYYFFILEELYRYLFLRAIQYKHGVQRTPWEQVSQYGSILKDKMAEPSTPYYLQSIMGFKFIDDYIYGFSLNKEDINKGLEEIISKYQNNKLSLFSLQAYYSFSESEVLGLLGILLFEIVNHKYSQKYIKEILIILAQIRYSCEIYFDIDIFCNYLADLIVNDEDLLSYHLREANHHFSELVRPKYQNLANQLIQDVKVKELNIAKKELYLKDKFYNINSQSEGVKDFVIANREKYSQQTSFLIFFGGVVSICRMIRDFDNQKLLDLREVLQWLYWYGSGKDIVKHDEKGLKLIIRYIDKKISNKKCDKIRVQNLFWLKKALESTVADNT